MQISIRTARTEDTEAILDLMVRVINATVELPYRADMIENVTQNLTVWHREPDECFHFIAEDGSKVVGVILVKAFWNLCSLFVRPEWQHNGIGRQLVHAAIDACRDRSPKQAIYLNAAPSAVSFYRGLGFTSKESSQQLPTGFQAMQLALVPATPNPSFKRTRLRRSA
jgi:GNAT superfamily N-acetyltransferase